VFHWWGCPHPAQTRAPDNRSVDKHSQTAQFQQYASSPGSGSTCLTPHSRTFCGGFVGAGPPVVMRSISQTSNRHASTVDAGFAANGVGQRFNTKGQTMRKQLTIAKLDQPDPMHRSSKPFRLTGGALLVILIALAGCGDDDSEQGDPGAAPNTYASGINTNSVDDAMAAFAVDSRMIDHPLNPGELNGKVQIRRGVSDSVESSRVGPDPYAISDVVVEGDTVSWSYVWINIDDDEFCGEGNEIDVNSDGLIVESRCPEGPGDCDE
jgi:hypothetical protein